MQISLLARNTKALFLTWSASALYVWTQLRLRWIPHDDGALGQAAEWINQGLLPHRDFIDVYTGGLSQLHALAFRLMGPSLLTLRLVLFAAFLLWVPAVFYIATRVAGTIAAVLITLLAVVWSVPNYPASMPSWYNLFFATAGVAALFRHLEDPRARWLVLAGVCGGLSFLMKVVGLYYVAGVLLYLVYRTGADSPSDAKPTAYATFVTACLGVFVIVLLLLIRKAFRPGEVFQFVAPSAAVAGFLMYEVWTRRPGPSRERFARLFSQILPFAAGVAAPIVVFLVPYVLSSSAGAFINGVFLLPMRRFTFATQPAPVLSTLVAVLPVVAWAGVAGRIPTRFQRGAALAVAAMLTVLLVASRSNYDAYQAIWRAVRNALPVLAVIGAITLARRHAPEDSGSRARAMLLLSVTAVCALVQFPFAAPIYFCYIAPLVGLTALAFFGFANPAHKYWATALTAFLIAFPVLRTHGTDMRYFGVEYHPQEEMRRLDTERGGIWLPALHADVYQRLSVRLRELSKNGYTWASPDAPEVYFLSGLQGVLRAPFEFFDDAQTNEASILAAIDAHQISAVVIQTQPPFSPPITESLYHQLAQRFPLGQRMGPFILMWHQ